MTALQFGTGWRDRLGRQRTLLWVSDLGWLIFDDGTPYVTVIRRRLHDEFALRGRLLGWEDYVDEPAGRGQEWVEQRIVGWWPTDPDCIVCQGEGYVAGPEGIAVRCGCDQS